MAHPTQPLAPAFAALAAELRAMAQDCPRATAPLHALILLALARILLVLEQIARPWDAARTAPATSPGYLLLADATLRPSRPRTRLCPAVAARVLADWRSLTPGSGPARAKPVLPRVAAHASARPLPARNRRHHAPVHPAPAVHHRPARAVHPMAFSKGLWAPAQTRAQFIPI
jgi:hypothetical protein